MRDEGRVAASAVSALAATTMERQREEWTARHRAGGPIGSPSPFVREALERVTPGPRAASPARALDVACGRGRHALLLAERGYEVDAVDWAVSALAALAAVARGRGLRIRCLAADVTAWPLPRARYDLVVVVSFLAREIFAALREAVIPGGALLVETFLEGQERLGHPRSPSYLLRRGELADLARGWQILAAHEGPSEREGQSVMLAGVLARRPPATRA